MILGVLEMILIAFPLPPLFYKAVIGRLLHLLENLNQYPLALHMAALKKSSRYSPS